MVCSESGKLDFLFVCLFVLDILQAANDPSVTEVFHCLTPLNLWSENGDFFVQCLFCPPLSGASGRNIDVCKCSAVGAFLLQVWCTNCAWQPRAKYCISKICLYKLWMSLSHSQILESRFGKVIYVYIRFCGLFCCCCYCFLTISFRLNSDLVHHWVCKGVEEVRCSLQQGKKCQWFCQIFLLWKSTGVWEQEVCKGFGTWSWTSVVSPFCSSCWLVQWTADTFLSGL